MAKAHEIEVFVRFSETDALGHVNNTSHFLYFEEARTKLFRKLYPNRDASSNFVLASIKCDYLAQAFADQTLKVVTTVSRIGVKSFTLRQQLINKADNTKIAEAEAVTVCFDLTEQKSIPVSGELRKGLERYMALKETNTAR